MRSWCKHDPKGVFALGLTLAFSAACASCGGENTDERDAGGNDAAVDASGLYDSTVEGDSGADSRVGPDAAPEIVDTGEIFLDECQSFNSACESSPDQDCGKCQYDIRYRGDVCTPQQPCDNVLLLWACMGCELAGSEMLFDRVLEAHPDFITICMQPNYPGEMLPSSLGAPEREETLVSHVFGRLRSPGDLSVWTGKNLLMIGCSAAASRYPVVAARYAEDANWVGSEKTGVCMSDGVVDVAYQDSFVGEMVTTSASCAGRHNRVARSYTVASPVSGHSCVDSPQAQCACDPDHAHLTYPGDCNDGDCVTFDSIVTQDGSDFVFSPGVSASSFAVQHWKLVTEGGSWRDTQERCDNDIVPSAPYEGLCALLDQGSDHDCVHTAFPDRRHCSIYYQQINTLCVDWFLSL
jgi:hypothetical protein